ncbi:MAG TPA: hypothetical protein IAD45_05150 [Candidatus Faecimonas intestinavium]|nr:hypothetical protein [Candidatus Faecimonas intestinavium]
MNNEYELNSGDNSTVGYVQLPLTQKGLSEFISNLLGEPQRVQGVLDGSFIVDISGIEKLYTTIMQRIKQQNKAQLIEFISKVYFENETNVTIKDLAGLTSYRNLEDLKVIRIELTWSFLIEFEDKEAPEKQTIRICFDVNHIVKKFRSKYIFMRAGIIYEINYTARTWGIDIENLIRIAINSTFIQKNKLKEVITKIKTPISIIIPSLIYIIIFSINVFFVNNYIDNSVIEVIEKISNIEIGQQFSFVAKYIASIPWYQFTTYNNLFLILMLIVCIIFGVYLDDVLDNILMDKSFIFLADDDKATIMQKVSKELGKQKTKYFITLFINIMCGVFSNFIFQIILGLFGLRF